MSAFNAFFAQLTGGGAAAGDAPPSATTASAAASAAAGGSADHRGNSTTDGGGGGGGRADGAFGVPLTGAAVTYDPENDRSRFGNPQCTTVTTLPEVSRRRGLCKQGALVVANADFTCYGISSNIRVMHRPTGARALIKPPPHLGNAVPQDICLLGTTATATANTASGLLACATSEGDVLIWELRLRASVPGVGAAASADKAVEVSTQLVVESEGGGAQSVAWHTSGMRMLAVVSGSSVVINDFISQQDQSTHLPGAVCKGHYKQITNASFSRGNGDVLATASEDGTVRVWDTRPALLEATPSPQSIACLRAFRAAPEGSTLSRVLVVDSDMALVTGDEDNRLLKVWPAPESNGGAGAGAGALEGVLPSQVLSLPGRGALSLEVDPGGEFVFAADTEEGLLYALHLAKGGQRGIRMDYLRPYSLAHPVQSFTVLSKEPEPEYGYEDSPPSAEDRILQLVCAQTKPVQIYRIAVRDALPPAGVFAKPANNGNGGGPADDDSKVGGDPPVSSAPEKVEEEEEEEGVVVAAGVRRNDDDAEEEGDVDVGVVVDSVAVSKEGGAVGGGGESAPSFEKKLDMDITDEPLGLSPTAAAAVASSPPVSASPHPSPASSDGGGSRSSRTSTSTSTSSADSSLVDEDQVLPATMASKPTASISPGYVSSSAGTPSGVMLGDGAAGGGDVNVGSSSNTTTTTARTTAAGMDIRGEEAGGAAAATSVGGADSSPTAATAAVDGRDGKDSARAPVGGLGVTATALAAAMADALSDTSSGVGGAGGPSPVLNPSAPPTNAAADVGGAFSSGVSKGEGTSSSSSYDASKRAGMPSPMMLGESAAAAAGGGGEDRGGALWAAAVEAEIASAEMSSSTTMPAAAPRERVATEELRRFLAPGDVGGLGAAAGVAPSSPSAAVGQASGAAVAAAATAAAAAAEAETETEEEEEDDDGEGESSEDFGLEDGEQSVSVSVSEERQEVGATTTEEAASFVAAADGGGLGGGGGGGGQATGGGGGMLYSSSGEESMGASRRQGGGEGVRSGGVGGGGGGWVGRGGEDGAGEPSASGSSGVAVASAHGDASGGSGSSAAAAAAAAVPPSAMQQQQQMASTHRREADTSAGASPIPMVPRHHPLVAGSPSGENAGVAAQQQHEQQQPSSPPLPPPPTVKSVVAAVLDPTAGGEASRDGGAARSVGRPIPGVNVDESATQALRSLLMRGGNRGGGRSGGGGSASGEGEENRGWSSGEMAGGGGGGGGGSSTEGAGGIMQSIALPRADAEGAGAGLARPPNPATDDTRSFLASLLENPNHNSTHASSSRSAAGPVMSTSSSTSAALAVGGGPVITLPPPALPPAGDAGGAGASTLPASSLPGVVPALPEMRSVPSTSLSVGHTPRNAVLPSPATGGGGGRASLFSSTSMAEVTAGAPTGAPVVSGSRSLLVTPTAQAPPLAPPGMVPRQQQQQQQQQPRPSGGFDAVDAGIGRAGGGAVAGGMDTEELIDAITARVNADMAARMSGLQSSLEQTVASCCRRTILASTASAEDTRANERAALVGDISSSVDRSVRRGMVETVATPLAKLVVSTARQVVVDPLQASMSTMHGHQQRQQQALAAAAAAGAQAGVQSQAAGMATATARAQAGNVRRELLESREDLSRDISRAVASAVQEPVGVAFRECFEGQLIPRIQSAVQRMFEQINDSLTRGLQASPLVNNRAGALAEDVSHVRDRVEGLESGMRDVASALSGLGVKMERLAELTRAMQQTGLATAASVEAAAASAQAAAVAAAVSGGGTSTTRSMSGRSSGNATPAAAVDPREELHRLVGAGRVDDAMNRALSASDLPLVMWLCGRLDPVATPSTLPQHILLCLVQQFGASDLLEDTTAKLKWLQNCVLAIDPTEATIRAHLPVVLRQLKGALTTSTPIISQRGGTDVSVVRLTTHVVNSLASMLPPAGSEAVAL